MKSKSTVTIKATYINEVESMDDAEEPARNFIENLTGDYGEGDTGGKFTVDLIEFEDVEEV